MQYDYATGSDLSFIPLFYQSFPTSSDSHFQNAAAHYRPIDSFFAQSLVFFPYAAASRRGVIRRLVNL